jgi:putative transposase
MQPGSYYERNLPHWHPTGKALFVTWQLHGSLPAHVRDDLQKKQMSPGKRFSHVDQELGNARFGPLWLADPRIACCVVQALWRGARELNLFELHAFAVMPNHVHLLLSPCAPLTRITRGVKMSTASKANELLRRTGQRFWQEESFDHWIRNAAEFERIKHYIERNPVKAGLCKRPEDWPWSSASPGSTGL